MNTTRWFDRKFEFSFGTDQFDPLLQRLQRAPDRLRAAIAGIAEDLLRQRPGEKWSVKENIGHLVVLEPLWQQRVLDIKARKTELSPADLNNGATDEGQFNGRPVEELLNTLAAAREQTVRLLEGIQPEDHQFAALHPRLGQPMRIVDHMYFVAEHDDHHLATIGALLKTPNLRTFGGTKS
jgi:uncharacterized damage-inducible protein DinB